MTETNVVCQEKHAGHTCPCPPCQFGEHCGRHTAGCHRDCTGPAGNRPVRGHRRFEGWRPREQTRPGMGPVPKDRPRFYGTVFPNGTTVLCWGPPIESVSVFSSFAKMWQAHGHPDTYRTEILWLDDEDGTEVRKSTGTAYGEFRRRLHHLMVAAGLPSARALAKDITSRGAHISHTTLSQALSPRSGLPSWKTTEVIVEALDGDVEEFRLLWAAAAGIA